MRPIFYRIVPGSIRDVSSLLLSIKESKVKDIILVGDKGFYSADNIKELDAKKIRYILPLKRNSQLIDYSPLMQAGKKHFDGHFLFENRVIWHYEHVADVRIWHLQRIAYITDHTVAPQRNLPWKRYWLT